MQITINQIHVALNQENTTVKTTLLSVIITRFK